MNENSLESTKPLMDTNNVLTALTSNDGSLTVTLTINKGTATRIVWAFLAVVGLMLVFLGMNLHALNVSSREDRLAAAALDEKRMENRMAWKQLGVDGLSVEDHDISDILKEVRKKHPLKED